MSYTYWLHPKIQNDINEAYAWYEDQRPGLGMTFLIAVETKIEEIVDHPQTLEARPILYFAKPGWIPSHL